MIEVNAEKKERTMEKKTDGTPKSKYPENDFRRSLFERKFKQFEWEKFYHIAHVLAKEFSEQDLEDPTIKKALRCSLYMFVRFTSEFCGELTGYLVTAEALKVYNKIGRINARKDGPHYMEHLIPVDQFTRELVANPTLENVKKLYKKPRSGIYKDC